MKRELKGNLLILLAAFIWGTAFLAQKEGASIGTFTFNGIRFIIGGLFLLPVIVVLDRIRERNSVPAAGTNSPGTGEDSQPATAPAGTTGFNSENGARAGTTGFNSESSVSIGGGAIEGPEEEDTADYSWNKTVLIGGFVLGVILFVASSVQQYGIQFTTLGKAGFITALYSVIVPVISVLLGKKVRPLTWIGVMLGVIGLYLLSMFGEKLHLAYGDAFMIVCAFGFAIQILVIDYYSPKVDGVKLSCIEFLTVGVISLVPMILIEAPDPVMIIKAWQPILYAGVLSSGVAYTLQIVGQKYAEPTQAALIMCLEAVFSLLTGFVVLGERMSLNETLGTVLIFAAVVLAQVPEKKEGA